MCGELVESIVYDTKFDCSLKHAVKYNKTPTGILSDYQALRVRSKPAQAFRAKKALT